MRASSAQKAILRAREIRSSQVQDPGAGERARASAERGLLTAQLAQSQAEIGRLQRRIEELEESRDSMALMIAVLDDRITALETP